MGNSSSKSSSHISSPTTISGLKSSAYDSKDNADSPIGRRATTYTSSSTNSLAPAANSHRRSRSALVGSARDSRLSQAPPPPYAVAVANNGAASLAVPSFGDGQSGRHGGAALRRPASVGGSASSSTQHRSVAVPSVPQRLSATERAEMLRRPMRQHSVENALDTLRRYNTVIVVDDSGSMEGKRWREAREALATLADIASKYDTDGIDICFLNNKKTGENMKDSLSIRRLFDSVRPAGITPIGEKLEQLLLYYMESLDQARSRQDAGDPDALKAIKPVNYIILTDGAPTDDPEDVIVNIARRLDRGNYPLSQLGLQFVQIGNSPEATAFLNELDNGLSDAHGIRDIVDTTPYLGGELNAEMIIKILLGGINRRVDRRGGQSVI